MTGGHKPDLISNLADGEGNRVGVILRQTRPTGRAGHHAGEFIPVAFVPGVEKPVTLAPVATYAEALEAIHRARGTDPAWPDPSDRQAWSDLANVALQRAIVEADEIEWANWSRTINALIREGLPHAEFLPKWRQAISARTRDRKAAAKNIRYRFGFADRPQHLVQQDIIEYLSKGAQK
jgi:hypothetical protein